MPQSTPERRARWVDDSTAIKYLIDRGFKLTKNWNWLIPPNHLITAEESDAMCYMIEEWDFGGWIQDMKEDGILHVLRTRK